MLSDHPFPREFGPTKSSLQPLIVHGLLLFISAKVFLLLVFCFAPFDIFYWSFLIWIITKLNESNSQNNLFGSDPVTDTCNSTPSDHFVTLPDGCFEDSSGKNKVNIGECDNHPCLRADSPSLELCDEAERCCQPGTVSDTTVRCGHGEFKMKRVVNCRCDACKERNTIVKGVVYVISTLMKCVRYLLLNKLVRCPYMVRKPLLSVIRT